MIGTLYLVQSLLVWVVPGPCNYTMDPNQRLKEILIQKCEKLGHHTQSEVHDRWAAETNLGPKENVSSRLRRDNGVLICPYVITDSITVRLYKILYTGVSRPEQEKRELDQIAIDMQRIIPTARVCDFTNRDKCDLTLDRDVPDIMTRSRNPEELKYFWIKYHEAFGKKIKENYKRYVELNNKWAKSNGYKHIGHYWLREYETNDFNQQIDNLFEKVKPLYLQLHAYVRRQLYLKYGEDNVTKDGPIPAHLLRSVWSSNWIKIANITAPFPNRKLPDVSEAMVKQEYNATRIVRLAESFFVSLNMSAMPELFWKNSILEQPRNVNIVCHPSAWDFHDGKDFRIKQCTRIDMANLLTTHHEMGHVQYFIQYANQPLIFQAGANPAFHEAVGDTITLSVMKPSYLKTVGLLDQGFDDNETSINSLYFNALNKVTYLPFTYMLEKWRWSVLEGRIPSDAYNCNWWSVVEKYQGTEPPIDRSEEHFDSVLKYHTAAFSDHIKYFVAHILQFQFHKALCIEAGLYDPFDPNSEPLHECNIYGSAKAGNLLKSVLKLGSSVPWRDALEKLTGQREMDSSAILEYFEPLMKWLKLENAKTNEYIGWKPSKRRCTDKK